LAPLDALALELAADMNPFDGPLLATLERAIRDRTGERVPRDAWDLRAVPAYFGFYFRVVEEHDKVLGHGRDLAELQRTLGARAKQVWAAVPRERYERTGLTAWDIGELPAQVTLDVGGRRLVAYPALVDGESSVAVRLLESAAAAAAATREGLRRLILLQLRTSPGKLEAQLPGGIGQGPLAAVGTELSPRRQIVLRALDEAFRLNEPDAVPRTKAAFAARLAEGTGALSTALAELGLVAADLEAELAKVRSALKPLAGKPGIPRAVYDDVQGQLAHLVPPELLRTMSLARLVHITRYLRAIGVRLQRQANDPQKDQQKAAQVVPFWQRYLTRREELRAKGRVLDEIDDFGWLIEELRVQTFAPELKTAVPVSPQRLQDVWAIVSR
jgi:ATP-dependent helicase HrpA